MAVDPLVVLRDCIRNNEDIREEEEHIYLGETLLPRNTVTNFKSSVKGQGHVEYYTLDALLFFLKNSSLPHATYHARAKEEGIQFVKRYDRKSLLKYLTGSSDNMTEVTPVESEPESEPRKRGSSTESNGHSFKKRRADEADIDNAASNSSGQLKKSRASSDLGKTSIKKNNVSDSVKTSNIKNDVTHSVKTSIQKHNISDSEKATIQNDDISDYDKTGSKTDGTGSEMTGMEKNDAPGSDKSSVKTINAARPDETPVKKTKTTSTNKGSPVKKSKKSDTTMQVKRRVKKCIMTSSVEKTVKEIQGAAALEKNNEEASLRNSYSLEERELDTDASPNSSNSVSVGTQTDPDNQAATIQAFQVISNRLLKFLQDDLGLSRDEQESVLEGKKITRRINPKGKPQRCFVAIPHPIYEWDTVKEDTNHVVSGQRINRKACDIERRYQCVLDNCLKRGESDLKDSLSLLISHMRDLNKSNLSETEVELSCKRTLEHCLTSAQEDFREMFESLLSVVEQCTPDMELQRWLSESEVELRKLLYSLMLSLQTLRDVSPCSRTLFHFPEPIMSIAMNPTKVTHSVVLEIYVRLGLAELRRILIELIGSIEKARTAPEPTAKQNRRQKSDQKIDQTSNQHLDSEDVDNPGAMGLLGRSESRSSTHSSDVGGVEDSPRFASTTLVESIKNEWSGDEGDADEIFRKELEKRMSKTAQNKVKQEYKNVEITSSTETVTRHHTFTDAPTGSDLYSAFKTNVKNTLVTSFKKRIQEKIEASATTEECLTWLRSTRTVEL